MNKELKQKKQKQIMFNMETNEKYDVRPASETGRFTVTSARTGKSYIVEPLGADRPADWGSVNPATGEFMVKKGWGKYTGAIDESESIITKENGFNEDDIHYTKVGESPLSYIEKLDAKYPAISPDKRLYFDMNDGENN